jgi:O-antigen ligase
MNSRQFIYLLFISELILSCFWYASSAVTAMFLVVASVACCQAIVARKSFQIYSLTKLMLIYLLWLFVVAWQSAVPETAMLAMAMLAGLPIMYLFATNTPTFAHVWQYVRLALFAMGVVLAFWAMAQVFYHIGYGYAQGPLPDRNLFAALMNLLWFPAAFAFLTAKNSRFQIKQLVIGIGFFMISAGLFATTSRGGIATWLLLLPILLWAAFRHHQSRQRILLMVQIAALAYFCSAILLNATIADRTFQLNEDPSAIARFLLWKSGLEMLLAHPLVGSGWGTFVHYYPAFRIPQESISAGFFAHNDYLQLALEGGVPALLLQVSILLGLLIQLRRSMKRAPDIAAFESLALLLGVLALFIHALVNFIFYKALMNVLTGLYLARAAQLSDQANTLTVINTNRINTFVKYLLAGIVVTAISLPYCANLLGLSINQQSNVKIEHLVSDKFTVYKLSEFITAIQPQERIFQETILQTAELALEDQDFLNSMGKEYYRTLLDRTLQRFEVVRVLNANDPGVGVREAEMLIKHHAAFDGSYAYKRAHQLLNENLKADPYHVDSIITLSHLQRAEGQSAAALQTIRHARDYVLKRLDSQLIYIELLRQLAAPAAIAELDTIENELQNLRRGSGAGRALIVSDNYFPEINAKLDAIAHQIAH